MKYDRKPSLPKIRRCIWPAWGLMHLSYTEQDRFVKNQDRLLLESVIPSILCRRPNAFIRKKLHKILWSSFLKHMGTQASSVNAWIDFSIPLEKFNFRHKTSFGVLHELDIDLWRSDRKSEMNVFTLYFILSTVWSRRWTNAYPRIYFRYIPSLSFKISVIHVLQYKQAR